MTPPRFPGCRCNCQSRLGDRKEQSGLLPDRWIVTRDGDTTTVKRNPKYDNSLNQMVPTDKVYRTRDTPPDYRDNLTENEKRIIRDWVKKSKPFNYALRFKEKHDYFKGDVDKYEKSLAEALILSEIVERSSLKQAYDVQRGLGEYDVNKIKDALIEKELTGVSPVLFDDGLTAVSFDETTSKHFTDPDEKGEKYILVSSLKRGDVALFIGNENPTHNRKQGEILLPRKTGYYVKKAHRGSDDKGNIVNFIDVVFVRG